ALSFAFPKLRVAIIRKTRVSMNDSVLETFENEVYPQQYLSGLTREGRKYYNYPNGSRIHLFGMDAPDKFLGSRWDIVYVNECSELTEAEIEQIGSRLQAQNGPFN